MTGKSNSHLYKQLAYLAENFDFNDPEDAWAKKEYKEICKALGITKANNKKRREELARRRELSKV